MGHKSHKALGVIGTLEPAGRICGPASHAAIVELLGYCDRVLVPPDVTLDLPNVTPITTLADVHRVLTMTNGPP